MESGTQHRGACLCGSVSIAVTTDNNDIGVCHCAMCRKWGGGPLFAVECKSEMELKGEQFISVFASSEWAERGFCRVCGTHLFYRLKEGGHYAIPVGLLEFDDWCFSEQIFIDQKPGFYSFSQETKNLTEAEVFAQFS